MGVIRIKFILFYFISSSNFFKLFLRKEKKKNLNFSTEKFELCQISFLSVLFCSVQSIEKAVSQNSTILQNKTTTTNTSAPQPFKLQTCPHSTQSQHSTASPSSFLYPHLFDVGKASFFTSF